MKKHVRNTRLTRGEREPPEWVAARRTTCPNWSVNRRQKADAEAAEKAFKQFIFSELDRRIGAEVDAMAAVAQSDETAALFAGLVASGNAPEPERWKVVPERHWVKAPVLGRGRGRPKVDPVTREFLPAEDAARTVTAVREIFEDYWNKWNRSDPSAEEIAAEYVGLKLEQVRTRKKRATSRRPT